MVHQRRDNIRDPSTHAFSAPINSESLYYFVLIKSWLSIAEILYGQNKIVIFERGHFVWSKCIKDNVCRSNIHIIKYINYITDPKIVDSVRHNHLKVSIKVKNLKHFYSGNCLFRLHTNCALDIPHNSNNIFMHIYR